MAEGQLYVAGDERFDSFFRAVHALQVDEGAWPDGSKATRRPLVTALALESDASSEALVHASHDHAATLVGSNGSMHLIDGGHLVTKGGKADTAFAHAVEDTVHAELERSHHLEADAARAEELTKNGHELEQRIDDDFAQKNPGRVYELRRELRASFSVLDQAKEDARKYAREAGEFVNDMQRSLAFGATPPPGTAVTSAHVRARKTDAPKADVPKSDAPKAPKPDAPKPDAPKPEGDQEVFTP
jgi:hypothetical protein